MKWIIIIAVIVFVLGLVGFSAMNISVEEFVPETISDINTQGMTIEGDLIIDNGGLVPLYVSYVDYEVVFGSQTVATGRVDGGLIMLGENSLPISMNVDWESSVLAGISSLFGNSERTIIFEPSVLGISHELSHDLNQQD